VSKEYEKLTTDILCALSTLPSACVQYDDARIAYCMVRKRKMMKLTILVRRVQIRAMKEKTAMHMKKNAVPDQLVKVENCGIETYQS
jgi:hypothetical protein